MRTWMGNVGTFLQTDSRWGGVKGGGGRTNSGKRKVHEGERG